MKNLLLCASLLWGLAGEMYAQKKSEYIPEIHGTIRGKYEYQFEDNKGRFQVRNARFSLSGKVAPIVSYRAEIDLSDEGAIKMLDAYARITPLPTFDITIGQMRVPFTIDAHRSPHQQYFANRSFIAKQVGNVRDVGATLAYTWKIGIPVRLEAGIFNGSGLTNQKDFWTNRINYSAKAHLQLPKVFEKISFLGRFDCMSDHSNGKAGEGGTLVVDDAARKRLTVGTTLSLVKPFVADLRVNYENYFYDNNALAAVSERDKIVVELMVRF